MRRAVLALAACAALGCRAAGDTAQWYLQVDNDVVFATDRWYTSGVRIARVKPEGEAATEWGLVQEIYTPEARYYEPGVTDRAPAARLLVSRAHHEHTDRLFETIELQLGVRGPAALGRQATEFVHRIIAAPEVDWSRQEPNRVDASAIFARSHAFGYLTLHYGAALGTQISLAHVGGELRMGMARARTIYSPMLRFAATPPLANGNDEEGWSAFIGASGRAVLRNDLISRNYDPGGEDVSYRRAVARTAAGVTWSNSWASASFAVAQDTREFKGQRTPHKFGSLTVSIAF